MTDTPEQLREFADEQIKTMNSVIKRWPKHMRSGITDREISRLAKSAYEARKEADFREVLNNE